ncbi:16S rRNA (guanine(527)-N(7))-methyltransferase RsmG [Polycladidibacter hongkongensis]|uniref:16S rRNA (guanine(527)-N(7))-methyltransferase RsmG n=1 Tax=Polycladidibacter hongkongensis TaxID=1647556 RepID=UPI000829A76D|nr:16S rRNA (guanine(527)-N(7))-methyltransferase RsmG [Pseudovibrio hongkongensis]
MTSDFAQDDDTQIEVVQKLYPDVSRETFSDLATYVGLVRKWQPAQNLIAPSTMGEIWLRHIADSMQIQRAMPEALRWIDFGSGAGFPGLVTAILLKGKEGACVHLVESNQRKAAFLRTVARETGTNVMVHAGRIESVTEGWQDPIDGVSARALANLIMLCDFSHAFISRGAKAVFHKGKDFEREVAEASAFYELNLIENKSLIDPLSRVLIIDRMDVRATK